MKKLLRFSPLVPILFALLLLPKILLTFKAFYLNKFNEKVTYREFFFDSRFSGLSRDLGPTLALLLTILLGLLIVTLVLLVAKKEYNSTLILLINSIFSIYFIYFFYFQLTFLIGIGERSYCMDSWLLDSAKYNIGIEKCDCELSCVQEEKDKIKDSYLLEKLQEPIKSGE